MAKTNLKKDYRVETFEGGFAKAHQTPEEELERAVATCLLFEDSFYESGSAMAERIMALCQKVPNSMIAKLAIKARTEWKLRHVPLFLARELVRQRGAKIDLVLDEIIKRPDEITEFLSMYWKSNNGRKTLTRGVKKGIANALNRFNEYQMAKWNRNTEVKLRDALFLSHAKPKNKATELLFKRLIDGTMQTPDTWEVALSAGQDKKEAWTRLLTEKKLGQMALLMNLRNMSRAGVPSPLIKQALRESTGAGKALPFRFVAAAKENPELLSTLDSAMLASIPRDALSGLTYIVIDVSGSMDNPLSKGTMTRLDAASALAILVREQAEDVKVFSFSEDILVIPDYRGLALAGAISRSQPHNGTDLEDALEKIHTDEKPDRIIVITDEQSSDGICTNWAKYGYILNVAGYQPALPDTELGWTRINGFSERVLDWIRLTEGEKIGAVDEV